MTQAVLATIAGLSEETVCRNLSLLKDKGLGLLAGVVGSRTLRAGKVCRKPLKSSVLAHLHLQFLSGGAAPGVELAGTYDPWLVALSVLISSSAAFTALQAGERMSSPGGAPRRAAWLSAGAFAMGCGVWCMHFVGMLAFELPIPVRYDAALTALSVIPAVAASAVTLHFLDRGAMTFRRANWGGLLMAAGIGTMHYCGMAAMIMDADMAYDPFLFALSLAVAHVLAASSLYLKSLLAERAPIGRLPRRLTEALLMGSAVAGMHYTGMSAAHYFPLGPPGTAQGGMGPTLLAVSVSAATILLLLGTIATAALDRRVERDARAIRRLIETAPDAFVTVDAAGLIRVVNAQTERLFGYGRDELLGRPLEMLLPERFRKQHVRNRAGFADKPEVRSMGRGRELYGLRKDGAEFRVDISLSSEETDSGLFVTSIIRDISDRIQLEEQLRQSGEKLHHAQKMDALGRLAGGIAYDFNNNLTGILGLCDLLAKRLPPGSGESADVADIRSLAARSAALTRQLLTFSRRAPAALKVCDANELIEATRHPLSRVLPSPYPV